jgi:hypothetical protein
MARAFTSRALACLCPERRVRSLLFLLPIEILESLLTQFETDADTSLWNSIGSIEEKAMFLRKEGQDLEDVDAKRATPCLEAEQLESHANLRGMVAGKER